MGSAIHRGTGPAQHLRLARRDGKNSVMNVKDRSLQISPVTTRDRQRVLCVAPAWNEGERIARVVKAVPPGCVDTTVVVDDGSSDQTADFAESAGAMVIRAG